MLYFSRALYELRRKNEDTNHINVKINVISKICIFHHKNATSKHVGFRLKWTRRYKAQLTHICHEQTDEIQSTGWRCHRASNAVRNEHNLYTFSTLHREDCVWLASQSEGPILETVKINSLLSNRLHGLYIYTIQYLFAIPTIFLLSQLTMITCIKYKTL